MLAVRVRLKSFYISSCFVRRLMASAYIIVSTVLSPVRCVVGGLEFVVKNRVHVLGLSCSSKPDNICRELTLP